MLEPVTFEELELAQPFPFFPSWIEKLCARYRNPEWNDYFVARRGLTNKLQGELVPLAQLCHYLASDRPDSKFKYFATSGQSFDAHVLSCNGDVQEVLEVTLACDGYRDAIASECLKKYGWAPLWSPLCYAGRRMSRDLPLPEIRSMGTKKIVEDGLALVRKAVKAKSSSGKYEGVNLVVGLEDFRFLPDQIEDVKVELSKIQSNFKIIYYVGLDDHFFYTQFNKE